MYGKTLSLQPNQLDASFMRLLIDWFHVEALVETGTWVGETAEQGSRLFKEVYTVELGEWPFQESQQKLKPLVNVHSYLEDSPDFLFRMIPSIQHKMVFWLDAHWCGNNSAQKRGSTPIREELIAIQKSGLKDGVILIDDIRHFHRLPPDFPEYGSYPPLSEVKELILAINPSYQFLVLGDMAMAYLPQEGIVPSPLAAACTVSRLFEGGDCEEVLAAEKIIRGAARTTEARAIEALQRYVRMDPTQGLITVHLMLWKALLQMGKGNYKEASVLLQQVKDVGYSHWRIDEYLAEMVDLL